MYATLYFNGTPVNVTVEPGETYSATSVQGQVKALTNFTNQVAGKATITDVKDQIRGIKLSGSDR